MPENEERTFFFYSDGYLPQELGLGHLVFGTYTRPTTGRQCSMELLSEAELKTWANVQLRSNCCYSSISLREFGISATAINLVKAGVSVNQDNQHAVASERCRRIRLKRPQQFLSEKVLTVDSTRETVQEWLSVSTHEHVLKKLTPLGWWPKIWMLTGIYEFEECTSFTWSKKNVSAEADVAAEITALLNIPLGASGSFIKGRGLYSKQTFPGKSIWAAEYQLVDAKFFRVRSNERDKRATPLQLPLRLRAIFSIGAFRESDGQHADGAQTEKTEPDNMAMLRLADELSSGQGDASESEDVFWEQFAEVEEDWLQDGHDIDE
jgi:hypothetical protein